ncbi:MAG: hypothetical protein P4L43_18930 [Syntrophobacteraceae bacterium]|nr:hypothetical protein [Syntrophobacteraceae bacterium]
MKKIVTPLVLLVLLGFLPRAQAQGIAPEEAGKYIGKQQTVCGKVFKAFYATRAKGEPTLLDLGRSHLFTVLIWGEDRNKFEKPPETLYGGKQICVTGIIKNYRGRPEMIVRAPSQIKAEDPPR